MQLHKNQSVNVVRNQFCAVLTETWISDPYGVRFGSTSSQNICDDQMLQMILSYGSFGELFLKSSFKNLYRNFLNEHSRNAFREHTQSPSYGPRGSSITEDSCITLQVIGSHMEMFIEVEWRKSNATARNQSVTVVRNQFCAALTENKDI